ncbi:MAG TPA: hypothetical protein VHI93_06495 [Candidatus Thermoplasmatota archaeon]|nr:hypothetical protein [Candidatus Thermoplasmatota archaeon]
MDAPRPPLLAFGNRRAFYWKTALLAATTLALAPILLWKHAMAAQVYLVVLVVIHVAGIGVITVGARRQDIAPGLRGFVIRAVAIVLLVALLTLAAGGLTGTRGVVFWSSLFAIWALHTAGLALLHVRGRRELKACPFA